MKTNYISHMHLVSLHVHTYQNIEIQSFDKVNAVMNISYGQKDDEHILYYHVSVQENQNRLYSLKCEYHYQCHQIGHEKQMIKKAIESITPQIEDIISLINQQIIFKTN